MSRAVTSILTELLALLPLGWAWSRSPKSNLARTLTPLATGMARIEAAAEDLMAQLDPRRATHLLKDFERVLGADPCGRDLAAMPVARRQAIAHRRWTARGGASAEYFKKLAAAEGFEIEIEEFWPFECGVGQAGDELGGDDQDGQQFIWIAHMGSTRLVDFECGASVAGDSLGTWDASDIECDIQRLAPLHTIVLFSYLET